MRDLRANAIILIAYLIVGVGSFLLAIPPGFLAPVWLPGAVGLASVLIVGHRALPAIALGMFALTLPYGLYVLDAGLDRSLAGSFGLAAAAVAQAVIAKRLIHPGDRSDLSLESGAQLIRLIAFGAIFASMCGAALASAWLTIGGFAPPQLDFFTAFLRNWTGNAVACASLTPIILLLFASKRVSRTRKRNVALAFLLLCAIGIGLFSLARINAIERRDELFNAQVTEDHIALQERLNGARRRLESLEGFFAASENVTRDEFEIFIDIAFGQFDSVNSVHWLVVEDADSRSSHAILAPVDHLRFDTRRRIPVAPGRRLVTDFYFEGLTDLIDDLLASGTLSASSLRGDDHTAWLALAIPAFSGRSLPDDVAQRRENLQGIAIGTFRIDAILTGSFQRERQVYNYRVNGLAADGSTAWQYGSAPADSPLATSRELRLGGQIWRIDYVATDRFLAAQQDWVSWAVIVVGLCFVSVLNALALLSTARTDLVQRLVDEKTVETLALSRNLSLILEHAADAIMGLDADGRGVLVNPAAAKLLGYEPEELTGRNVHDLIHPVDMDGKPHARADCPLVLRGRESDQHSGVERFRRKDGSDFFAEYSSEVIRDTDGRSLGDVTIMRDITERLEAEADRDRFIERLTRANEELERFAFVASHDLQEPLRLISNFTGLLASRYNDNLDEAGRTYIRHTLDATVRMQALITDLLAYGRLNSDVDMMNRDVDLAQLVTSTLDTLGPSVQAARDNIKIGPLPVVRGNPARLGQLLQNLIGNAVKFQPVGQDAHITIDAEDIGDAWRLSITDNGIGIKPEYREQVFMPFKRLHSPDTYPGSGMGLAICRKIVESHGGVLTVSDNEPCGSVFRFTLPKTGPDKQDQ
ncbi:ATP-binding protein [Maricaulis maris]|uniref:histidine kinase n=1 Tax=Maricaulis maris TaxID=74318 RepID=A0A495DNT7_9PROT|nr:ATP-binding protein [Maricaulis maris]RKR03689.1 PAS domain S-box-containing protein [Maricaulis maris]